MSNYFYIQSRLNGLVLTINGLEKGGNLIMYTPYGGANQLWKWGPDGTLVSQMGLVADIQGVNHASGTHCIGWNPNGGANQKWRFDHSTGVITSTMNNLVMDVANQDTKMSAHVIMWSRNGGHNQAWNLVSPDRL